MPLATGVRLGPYEIQFLIGAGGMGEVYRATDTRLDRIVALKVLPGNLAEDAEALGRFEREAKAIAALSHPNILAIHDFGSYEGTVYAAMELLEGETLRKRLEEGALPARKAIEIALAIATGLAAAHEKGIVHRDLKPENVFVLVSGQIKVLDFGLARVGPVEALEASRAPTRALSTRPGQIMGTVGYMAPEQVRGGPVDTRADIFSLGAVLYEMLSGKLAFHGDSAVETLNSILKEDPPSLSDSARAVSPALDRIVRRCLEKRPAERFGTAHDLAIALDAIGLDAISAASSRGVLEEDLEEDRPAGQSRLFKRLGLLAAGALVALGVTALWQGLHPAEPDGAAAFRWMSYSGRDASPAVSPDGRTIAFSSSRDGQLRIWLKQVSGEAEAPLTSGPDDLPRFAPNGTEVLFARSDGAGTSLFRAALLGGEARRLLEGVSEGDWSPDGRRVAFLRLQSEAGQTVTVVGVAAGDGSAPHEVAKVPGGMRAPRWAPDGQTIAMVPAPGALLAGAQQGVVVVDVEKRGMRILPAPDPRRSLSAAAWTGKGELVYLQAESVASAAGSAGFLIRQDASSGRVVSRSWSPSSALVMDVVGNGQVVFDTRSPRQNLREVPLAKSAAASGRWLSRGESTDRQPVYSPDGERVAFSSNRGGGMNLWVVSAATGNLRRVTDSHINWDPAFTRDGKSLVWSSNRGGNFEIWMADVDGSGPRQVTEDGVNAENPTATPDGGWIVYSSGNPQKAGLWKIRPDGTQAKRLVAGRVTLPDVSPDGLHAVYRVFSGRYPAILRVVRLEDGQAEPFEIDVDARRRTTVTLGRARWMPDGRAIAFVGQDEAGAAGVFVQDFSPGRDTSTSRRKLIDFDPDVAAESFGVSPDGRLLVLAGWVQLFSLMEGEGILGLTGPPWRTPRP